MRPTELLVLLKETITAKLPVLITGAPGIGKSDLVAHATADAGADLILSHPAVADPTDVKGLPWIVDGKATFLPFGELQQALDGPCQKHKRHPVSPCRDCERLTVWFLDDLGQASAAVQASYMQLLLARRVNGHVLSDNVVFIAATNRRTDRAGVTGILEPVKSRFATIVELEPHLDDWCTWAIGKDVSPMLIAFLRFRPDLLCKFSASADLTNSPVPRTWAHTARLLDSKLPQSVQLAAIAGAVGEGAATEFVAFMRLYNELPSIDAILLDPDSVKIPKQPATLYALSAALASRTTQQNFGRVAKFITRMVNDGHGEFGVLCVRDAMQRDANIVKTTAFVKLATGELGQLISGK